MPYSHPHPLHARASRNHTSDLRGEGAITFWPSPSRVEGRQEGRGGPLRALAFGLTPGTPGFFLGQLVLGLQTASAPTFSVHLLAQDDV